VKGAGDFDAKLFVDAQTNLPLMLSWSDKEPLAAQTITRGGGPGGGVAPGQTVQMGGGATFTAGGRGGQPMSAEDIKKMQDEMAAREAARKVVEFRIYYSNYKAVNGVKLPHTLQRSVDGKPTEETTFDQIKVNPKIDSKKFTVTK
jgi:hypothetical protein